VRPRPREAPLLFEKSVRLCEETGVSFDELVARSGLPFEPANEVYATATMTRPRLALDASEEGVAPQDPEVLQLFPG
jgi:hypothetical protein